MRTYIYGWGEGGGDGREPDDGFRLTLQELGSAATPAGTAAGDLERETELAAAGAFRDGGMLIAHPRSREGAAELAMAQARAGGAFIIMAPTDREADSRAPYSTITATASQPDLRRARAPTGTSYSTPPSHKHEV